MSEKRGALRFIAAANVIFAILFVIIGFPFFWGLWEMLRSRPETDAQVIRSEVVAQSLGCDNFYRAKLQMVYTVWRPARRRRTHQLRKQELRSNLQCRQPPLFAMTPPILPRYVSGQAGTGPSSLCRSLLVSRRCSSSPLEQCCRPLLRPEAVSNWDSSPSRTG